MKGRDSGSIQREVKVKSGMQRWKVGRVSHKLPSPYTLVWTPSRMNRSEVSPFLKRKLVCLLRKNGIVNSLDQEPKSFLVPREQLLLTLIRLFALSDMFFKRMFLNNVHCLVKSPSLSMSYCIILPITSFSELVKSHN